MKRFTNVKATYSHFLTGKIVVKGATKLQPKIIFVPAVNIGKIVTEN